MPSYLDYYELRKAPFDVRPGRGPVLATRPLRDTLSWLTDRIEAGSHVLGVRSEAGAGRSSVARVLPGRLAATSRVARVMDPSRPWPELRVSIADHLLLDVALGRDSLVTARSQGDRVVLVVDSAERADEAFFQNLDELLALRGPARERLIQIVVFARAESEPGAPEAPVWRWLERNLAVSRELEPISPNEIHGYISKRLENAGFRSGALFTESASLVVYRHTRGVPRRINVVCDIVLREGVKRESLEVDAHLVSDTMANVVLH
jgi:general secretion pathway protein A